MKGYVGVGIVKEPVRLVTEFEVEVDGQTMPILDAPLTDPEKVTHDAKNEELCEQLVRIEWLETRSLEDAVWQTGLFTNQMPACKLRDRDTIDFLEGAFGVESTAPKDGESQAATGVQ